ncbi:uncharacterized protein [Amphiura filiformis]|uniref:uncharacterized protein n=1 Tax=Amphiura filiformis TaxID=82378 RepID=UPI003B211E0A
MRAIRSGKRDIVRLLLDEGIDVAYVLLVQKDVSPGKQKVLRENAKSYAEKYMPDMHPIIEDALKPYEEEGLIPSESEDEDIEDMDDKLTKVQVDEKGKQLSHLCVIL